MKTTESIKLQTKCCDCELRSESFFCNLSEKSLREFESLKLTRQYPKRARIFTEGQPAKGVYMLCQGSVKISACSQEGKVIVFDIAAPGKILGLSATIADAAHIVTAEALENCQINFIEKKDFLDFLERNNETAMAALKQLGKSYRSACRHSCLLGLSSSTGDKVATLLLHWSQTKGTRINGNGSLHLKISYTHEEIAQMIGVSRETVTRTLNDFRERNLVLKNCSGLIIPDIKKLKAALGTRKGLGKKEKNIDF